MDHYSAYKPDEESGDPYGLQNQVRNYACKLEKLIENEASLEDVRKAWKDFKMFYRRSHCNESQTRFEELKKDYKNYKKYLQGKLDKNPIDLKKDL